MPRRALVVDDEPLVRRTVARMLRRLGFEAVEAADGAAALAELERSTDFDLATLDWRMPGLAGIQLVERIRSEPRHAHTRLLMVTGVEDVVAVEAALLAGADGYLVKPVAPQLADKLAALGLVDEPRPRRASSESTTGA